MYFYDAEQRLRDAAAAAEAAFDACARSITLNKPQMSYEEQTQSDELLQQLQVNAQNTSAQYRKFQAFVQSVAEREQRDELSGRKR